MATCYPWNSPTGTCVSWGCPYELSCTRAGIPAVSRICDVFMGRQLLPIKVVVSGRTSRVTSDVFLCLVQLLREAVAASQIFFGMSSPV